MGRPMIIKTAEEMQQKIDEYFTECDGHPILDEDGTAVSDKRGNAVIVGAHPPTVTGLALFLGLKSRQALLNYQGRSKAFNDAISRAKARIEAYAEARLYDRDGCRGAMFTLERNFGWQSKDEASAEVLEQLDRVIHALDTGMNNKADKKENE